MSVYNSLEYKRAKKERDKLKKLLTELDFVGEVLYNNLDYSKIWDLIQIFEEVRIEYYVQYEFYEQIVKNKGKMPDDK